MFARRMFNANIGEISILPTGKTRCVRTCRFAGLDPSTPSRKTCSRSSEKSGPDLYKHRIDDFATVPIGGATNAFTPEALRRLMTGFLRGLQDADRDNRFRGITICETDKDRFDALQREFYRLCGTHLFDESRSRCVSPSPEPAIRLCPSRRRPARRKRVPHCSAERHRRKIKSNTAVRSHGRVEGNGVQSAPNY